MDTLQSVADRLNLIRSRVEAAARRAGRDPGEICIVAVSKGQPISAVQEARAALQRDFGENYLEEAAPKIQALDSETRWHMIGHVQSRKAKGVVELFPSVHSVDSLALARRLSRFAVEQGKSLTVFLECNVSGESTKFGWPAVDLTTWTEILKEWKEIRNLPNLIVAGLMTMAPYSDNPENSRPIFRKLRELRDIFHRNVPEIGLLGLSMGMSDDFEQAVEEGATVLRIGRAIFGPRG